MHKVLLLFGTGTGTLGRFRTYYAPNSPDLLGATGIAAGDIDLMTTGVSNDVALYLNNGAGTFTFPYRMGVIAGAKWPLYADFSGDRIADIAVLSEHPPLGFDGGVAVLLAKRPR